MKLQSRRVITWYSATLGIATGAVLYAYLGIGPVFPGILIFSGICYGSLAALRVTEEENNPYRRICEGIAAAGIIIFLPLLMLVDFLIALVVFLGFAQLALNFQTHDYRRFYMGMAVSLIGICVGAAESKSGFYLVFFLAYTICAGFTIGYAHMAQHQDTQPLQWDWTGRTRVGLLMIVSAVAIYLLLPRFPAGGWLSQPGSDHFYHDNKWEEEAKKNEKTPVSDQLEDIREKQGNLPDGSEPATVIEKEAGEKAPHAQEGHTNEFDYKGFQSEFNINTPDEKGHRFSNRIVARMRADHPQYLRMRIFDRFDGVQWSVSSDQVIKLRAGYNGVDLVPSDSVTPSALGNYEIYIEQNLSNHVPAAAVPVNIKFPATAIGVDMFGQIRSPARLKEGTAYAVTSQYHVIGNRLFAELDHQPLPSYTQLPPYTDPRIEELAGQITTDAPSQLAAAIALEQHLRTRYQYDFDSIFNSQNHTPLSEFLFERKSGHCEYFATALAIMLRTQNIPSRLVTGFSATTRNPLTGYYDIYALDGHAWVEAFVDGQGWVILEPTGYYDRPMPTKEQKLSAQQINDYVERQVKRRESLGQDELTLEGLLSAIWLLLYTMISATLAYIQLFIWHNRLWLLFMLSMAGAGWWTWCQFKGQWLAYCVYRRVKAYKAVQPDRAVNFYLSAIAALLSHAGFTHPPGCTIEQYVQHIQSIGAENTDGRLSAAFNRIHYNGEPGEQPSVENYKQAFQSLYAIGFRNLQSKLTSNIER